MTRPPLQSRQPSTVPSVFSLHYEDDDENSSNSSATPASPRSRNEAESSDIAVIGYSCRTPGGNNSPAELWDFLMKKGDASGEMPEMRWKPYQTRQPGNAEILAKTTSTGYFLDRLEDFDAPFFGISPREAEQMDPQQRLAVECAWEALEDAGIPPQGLAGSGTAVYMGVNSDDYGRLLLEDLPQVQAWMGVGTAFCGIPNRISYLLDLMGPSSAIDAACASSLVAIHHAKQALLQNETSLAIAGGVNALIGPGLTRVLDEAGAIASDGRCRSFDETAAGYGRGEGAGVVILKRLADAIEDDDNILAILKGSAVGADGKTNGIMAPCQVAQEQVARRALKEAKFSADSISYIEAHATSTPLGDPTECAAMANVYGRGARGSDAEPCIIGSIKPNIGHLEAGAGVMGFIKAIMVLQNKEVPPQANLENLSSRIDFENFKLIPVTKPTPLPANNGPLRAAIASYGYGGTVSHAVIEAAPAQRPSLRRLLSRSADPSEPSILLLSATNDQRLKAFAGNLYNWMKESRLDDIDLRSLSYTLAVKRGHHKNRSALVAYNAEEALAQLELLAEGKHSPLITKSRTLPEDKTEGAVWVFSGHGAQWDGMGRQLMETEPSFVEVIKKLEPIIRNHMDFSITCALRDGGHDTTDKVQIMTYAMQVGLVAVLRAHGVRPKAVVGHSLGELAAAVAAGSLTVEEGCVVCCVRARLYQKVAGAGAMILISLPFGDAAKDIEGVENATVAIDSSPSSCVISGTTEAIDQCATMWESRGVSVRRVKTDVAFHSEVLAPLAQPLRDGVGNGISPKEEQVYVYSTSMSDPRAKTSRDMEYWVNNMIKPVLLTRAVLAAAEDGHRVFLEISSHPIVTHSINETLLDQGVTDGQVIPTLLRNKNSRQSMLMSLGKLHCAGLPVDFKSVLPGTWLQSVPRTLWDHQPYWKEVTVPEPVKNVTHDPLSHTIVGSKTRVVGTDVTLWQTHLNSKVKPFPGNHPLHGSEIIPAAVLLNTFLSAQPGHALANVSLRVPVVVDPPKDLQLILQDNNMRICSKLTLANSSTDTDESSWLVNTTTQITSIDTETEECIPSVDISDIKAKLPNRLSETFSIDYLDKVGVSEMGFPWAVTEHLEAEGEMLARVDADPTQEEHSPHFHGKSWASILDAATSVSSTIFYDDPLLRMPTAIESVQILPGVIPPKISYIHVRKVPNTYAADIRVYNESGHALIDIRALAFAGIDGSLSTKQTDANLVHRIAWPPAQLAEEPLQFSKVTLVAGNSNLQGFYESQLASRGIQTQTISSPADLTVQDDSIVVLLADGAATSEEVYEVSAANCAKLLDITKALIAAGSKSKVFAITQGVFKGASFTALAQSPLVGLARVIYGEEPEVLGGLIDVEDFYFPMQAIKYIQNVDVIRVEDSVARQARLRPFSQDSTSKSKSLSFKVRPQGTYLITGGLGALGLEVARFLAEQGAKRLVLVSRRQLPTRDLWEKETKNFEIQQMLDFEAAGVSVYPVAVDMTAADASDRLRKALSNLHLPPVLGVVHAAGTLANEMVIETTTRAFNSVIQPKILGAMALDQLFPVGSLDFMALFSSCGQLLGFPGQAAYGSGNAFLDSLAARRRTLGENAISMMWTSWRGLGMASSTKYIDAELSAKGVTDVTKFEAFRAWQQIFTHDTDHAVILRALPIDAHEAPSHPILNDIVIRNVPAAGAVQAAPQEQLAPTSGPELEEFFHEQVIKSVADTLGLAADSIDPNVALTELGVDSVMTVELRGRLQKSVGVKVGPTLIWNCPTVALLVKHFVEAKTK